MWEEDADQMKELRIRDLRSEAKATTTYTALIGEFAYPMLARGHMIGALILGAKVSGEPYAPDESLAVAQVAQSVGVALDVLGARPGGVAHQVREALRSVEASNRTINDTLRTLPDAIAERLRSGAVEEG